MVDIAIARAPAMRPRPVPAARARGAVRVEGTLPELLLRLDTSSAGFSSEQAAERLRVENAHSVSPPHPLLRAFVAVRRILNPLTTILLVAGIASAFLGQVVEASLIGAMVAISAAIDTWQTARSAKAVARLQAQVTPTATVLRDRAWCEVPRARLVPGDIIRLAAGDLVPADARLLTATDLHVQQAALTGESLPAEKSISARPLTADGPDIPDLVYLGTSVVSGAATAVVFATGERTAFGDVVARLAARPDENEFERGTRQFGNLILQTVIFLVLFVLVVNIALGRNAMESLLFSVALAVGLTPEFLPMITTVTLAQGAVRMAREKVIVKHLSAIQNLGSIDMLCSDKTGTLTSGTMSLDASLSPFGAPDPHTLELARINSRLETGIASPLDTAILADAPPRSPDLAKLDEIPFDFERRRLSVVAMLVDRRILVAKGAPESILAVCTAYAHDETVHPLDPASRARIEETYRAASARGLRVLAVASRTVAPASAYRAADECELVLAGFLTFADHVLPGVSDSLARLQRDGVAVKILTGDNELVTRHLCAQVGIDGEHIVLGSALEDLTDLALARIAEQNTVFARVSPAQKHRIVCALKSAGHVVGFLGDGINDAPSLHAADVGISVAGAVDVAREAADLVLLERRLDVLHGGILAGRRASGNVLKYLLMGTSSNFGNMFSMAGAALFLPFLPMLPLQILLNNFLYDLAQITIPTDRVDDGYLQRPQRWNIHAIRRFMWLVGPVSSAFDFLTFFALLHLFHFGATGFHTGWFVESLATQTLVLFVIRTAARPWRDRPSTPLALTVLAVVAIGILLPFSGLAAPFGLAPLPLAYIAFLVPLVLAYLALVEVAKTRVFGRPASSPPQD